MSSSSPCSCSQHCSTHTTPSNGTKVAVSSASHRGFQFQSFVHTLQQQFRSQRLSSKVIAISELKVNSEQLLRSTSIISVPPSCTAKGFYLYCLLLL